MYKRSGKAFDPSLAYNKKQRFIIETTPPEVIHSSQQLQRLLARTQDPKAARHGLISFRELLFHLLKPEANNNPEPKQILLEYLEAVRPREPSDEDAIYLPDILENWATASYSHDNNVSAAAAVAISALLKVLSPMLDMAHYGIGICRTLMQSRELGLISRNLSALPKDEFILSPTLRLLREVVLFDGGQFADDIFHARTSTFKNLGRNMAIRFLGDGIEDPQRPSGRTNAISFFLVVLGLVSTEVRQEMLSQNDLVSGLFKYLRKDPPYLIREIINTLRKYVLDDPKFSHLIKVKVFNSFVLDRLQGLSQYAFDAEDNKEDSIGSIANAMLLRICTSQTEGGILQPNSGLYPPQVDPDNAGSEGMWAHRFDGKEITVRNPAVLDFATSLKPWSNLTHSELLLYIFKHAPELVAPYHRSMAESFPFDPKLTSTWIGYAAFLFNATHIPIPAFLGHAKNKYGEFPPPTSIVLDNIIPPCITEKVVTKRLAQRSSSLISLFLVRMLVISFQKLARVISMYHSVRKPAWMNGAHKLRIGFSTRIPAIRDILKEYLAIPETDLLQREAASRLLSLYPHVIPQSVQTATIDVSPSLLGAITRIQGLEDGSQNYALGLMELENLVAVADVSVGVRWFSKAGKLPVSLFTCLLQMALTKSSDALTETILASLHFVAKQHGLAEDVSENSSFVCLYRALQQQQETEGEKVVKKVWPFVDTCLIYCAGGDQKYRALANELGQQENGDELVENPISPLTMVFCEQFPFLVRASADEKSGEKILQAVVRLFSVYLSYCRAAGENSLQVDLVLKAISEAMPKGSKAAKVLKKLKKGGGDDVSRMEPMYTENGLDAGANSNIPAFESDATTLREKYGDDLNAMLELEPLPELDNSALTRWANKPVESLVPEGHLGALMLLLTSEHPSIRLEARTNLAKTAQKLRESTLYRAHKQVWLLISELLETVSPTLAQEPASAIFTSFATHALSVLNKPLHVLYPRVNRFLTDAPSWNTGKLPFISSFLHKKPGDDDNAHSVFYPGILWILTWLSESSRTARDVEMMVRNRRVVENLLTVSVVHAKTRARTRFAALGVLSRVADVEGGCDALVSRMGVDALVYGLEVRARGEGKEGEGIVCGVLREKIRRGLGGRVREVWGREAWEFPDVVDQDMVDGGAGEEGGGYVSSSEECDSSEDSEGDGDVEMQDV